jgi:hypothetical protein
MILLTEIAESGKVHRGPQSLFDVCERGCRKGSDAPRKFGPVEGCDLMAEGEALGWQAPDASTQVHH